MSPRSVTLRSKSAPRNAAWAASEARSGALSRSTSLAIIVVAIRSTDADGPPPRARRRRRRTTPPPTRSSWVSTPSASRISSRSSAVERAATASTELERSIRTSEASSARAAAAEAAGGTSPASTAADIASSAPRSGVAASLRAGVDTRSSLEAIGEIPEHGRADARAREHEGREDVEAQDRRHHAVTHAPVGLPRRNRDEHEPGDQRYRGGRADDEIGLLVVAHRATLWRTRPANSASTPTSDQTARPSAAPPRTSVR